MAKEIKVTSEEGIVTIRTPRLLLRQARPSDLEDLHVMMSDDDVMRYWYSNGFSSSIYPATKHFEELNY